MTREWLDLLAHKDRLLIGRGDECWPWNGPLQSKGYGSLSGALVHRVVYELLHGPIPAGLQIDHTCRNRRCCNLAHLEAVTPKQNYDRGYGIAGLALQWRKPLMEALS